MDIPSWHGRGGIRILEFGLAARISRSELALESVGGEVLDGVGDWGFDWHNHYAIYNHGRYRSGSKTFYNRNNYYRGGGERGVATRARRRFQRRRESTTVLAQPPGLSTEIPEAARGYAEPRGQSGVRSGAFSGYDHGGQNKKLFLTRKRQLLAAWRWRRVSRRWRRRVSRRRWRASVIEVSLCSW